MNTFDQKQTIRKARLLAAAEKNEKKAADAYAKSDLSERASRIPFGQPILVGHHSEKRHRRAIARAGAAMERSIAHQKKAEAQRVAAAAVGQGGISADDPDALEKLRDKLADLEISQDNMKSANRVIRKWLKRGVKRKSEGPDFDHYAAEMSGIADHFDTATARRLIDPDYSGIVGFASYSLTNNNANIKRIKTRIAQLEKSAAQSTKHHIFPDVCEVIENTEENRLQFIFDAKPEAEIRAMLKTTGFVGHHRKMRGNAS